MRRRPFVLRMLVVLSIFACAGWTQHSAPPQSAALGFAMKNVTAEAGIRFQHDNAASKDMFLPETMGAGCGWLDFDGDGLLDLFFVQSGPTPSYKPSKPLRNALYRNNGDGTFSDVTESSELGAANDTFGMGVAVGDFDTD